MRRVLAQARIETLLTLRRGESLLLVVVIPVFVLVFFTLVDVLPPTRGRTVDFLVPGMIALSLVASSLTSLSIATAFERQAGVLRLLGTTPLGRGGLLGAKVAALALVIVIQVAAVCIVGLGLGWRPSVAIGPAAAMLALGTLTFAALGFTLAGVLRAETNLAFANALFLVFVFLGGVVIPVTALPDALAQLARLLPAEPLSGGIRAALDGSAIEPRAVATLAVWAVGATVAASRWFRFDQ